ncbi:MAG: fructose-bisphosphate aldolase [candidate division Zixibacteria bacterium RBG_16_40_9]|nr:MAG: fructose-bisphosphate aldolase [candidate division Zixibacteria bacterium RBG_16_40_9]
MPAITAESRILDLRPQIVREKLGSKSKVCLLSSHDIFNVIRDVPVVIMTCNTRIKHVIPGIMKAAKELDAVVAFELAKTEGGLDGGYTGMNPDIFFDTVVGYAEERVFNKPFFIHADHLTVKNKSKEEFDSTLALIEAQIKAGYTSFALDASFNEVKDNVEITTQLAYKILPYGYGLETEVGEITQAGQKAEITTVEEAVEFIEGLISAGVNPDVLGINNGSKHGNYLPGEEANVDLKRTSEIYEAIKKYKVNIAQHGTTGTPLDVVKKMPDYGIRKANVGTEWQNVAHKYLPQDLFSEMQKWANENKKDIKFATKMFKKEIDNIDKRSKETIEQKACEQALTFINAFRAEKSAERVIYRLTGNNRLSV